MPCFMGRKMMKPKRKVNGFHGIAIWRVAEPPPTSILTGLNNAPLAFLPS